MNDNTISGFPGQAGKRLRPSGGYRQLRSFQAATVIYDATVAFCGRFLDKRSRTVDQMVQAARSGRYPREGASYNQYMKAVHHV